MVSSVFQVSKIPGGSSLKKLKRGGGLRSKHVCGFNTFFRPRGGPSLFDALAGSLTPYLSPSVKSLDRFLRRTRIHEQGLCDRGWCPCI